MTAILLTPAQRTALKGLAHGLPVTVHVGQGGVSAAVLKEVDVALTAHGLIKVRILAAERDEREAMMAALAEGLFCSPVQHIGRVVVLWRARPEDAMPAAGASAASSGRPAADKAPGNRRQLAVRNAASRTAPGAPRSGSTRSRGEGFEQRDRRPRSPAAAASGFAPERGPRAAGGAAPRKPSGAGPRRSAEGDRTRRPAADDFADRPRRPAGAAAPAERGRNGARREAVGSADAERPRAPRRSEGDVFATDVARGPRVPRRGEGEGFSADRSRPPRRQDGPVSAERARGPRSAEGGGAERTRAPRPGFGNAFGARRPSTPRRDGPARSAAPRSPGQGERSGPAAAPRGAERPRGPRKPPRD